MPVGMRVVSRSHSHKTMSHKTKSRSHNDIRLLLQQPNPDSLTAHLNICIACTPNTQPLPPNHSHPTTLTPTPSPTRTTTPQASVSQNKDAVGIGRIWPEGETDWPDTQHQSRSTTDTRLSECRATFTFFFITAMSTTAIMALTVFRVTVLGMPVAMALGFPVAVSVSIAMLRLRDLGRWFGVLLFS